MRKKESPTLEYKESITPAFLKTVSAFANYQTGTIVFGVDDSGDAKGLINLAEDRLRIENMINDSLRPVPVYSLDTNEKNRTITLTVQECPDKPYLTKGKAYRRSDTATIEVDHLELRRLTLAGSNTTFDVLPCSDTKLTFDCLAKKMVEVVNLEDLRPDVMRTLGLVTRDGCYTNAAAILADRNGFGGVDIVRFGSNINELRNRITAQGVSAIKQFDSALDAFCQYYQYEVIEGSSRKTVSTIPFDAFREAIANALVHRAWDVNSNITVSMYDERIEIASPGPLPSGITEDEHLNGHISHLRNPVVAQVFFRLRFIEMFGTGIARIKQAYIASSRKPEFAIREQSILVTLPVVIQAPEATLSEVEQAILRVLDNGARLSRAEISSSAEMSKDRTIRVLNSLVDKGFIHKEGIGRSTRYGRR